MRWLEMIHLTAHDEVGSASSPEVRNSSEVQKLNIK